MHGVEELVEPPYLFGPTITYGIVFPDGNEMKMKCRRHNFAGWRQRYDRVGPLLGDNGLKTGKVLVATVHILECRPMWEQAWAALKRDSFFFVQRSG